MCLSFLFIIFTSLNFIYGIVFICYFFKSNTLYWKIMICSPPLKRQIISHPSKRRPPTKPSILIFHAFKEKYAVFARKTWSFVQKWLIFGSQEVTEKIVLKELLYLRNLLASMSQKETYVHCYWHWQKLKEFELELVNSKSKTLMFAA